MGLIDVIYNKPFPSSLEPLFQSESRCEDFEMKLSFHSWNSLMESRTNYHHKTFALRLVLKKRLKRTRKWPFVTILTTEIGLKKRYIASDVAARETRSPRTIHKPSIQSDTDLYTLFINGCPAISCLDKFSKIRMLPNYKALQSMLSWEVSTFFVKQLQSYGSFKFKTFVWEMTT